MLKGKYLLLALCVSFALIAAPAFAVDVLYSRDMSTTPAGWTAVPATGVWDYTTAPVVGTSGSPPLGGGANMGLDPGVLPTGAVGIIGTVNGGNYLAGMTLDQWTLATGSIDCTGRTGVTLRYWRWLAVEDSQFDSAKIQISVDGGTTWTTVWTNPTAGTSGGTNTFDTAWAQRAVPLTGADGQASVRVRWTLGPTDTFSQPTEFGGWSIGPVQVTANTNNWAVSGTPVIPTALSWGQTGAVSVVGTNNGEGPWGTTFVLKSIGTPTTQLTPKRWANPGIVNTATVAPGANHTFAGGVIAPPLSTLKYTAPTLDTVPGLLGTLECNWNLWNPLGFVGNVQANGNVAITRFPDTGTNFAAFYIEELAGAVPFIVQGNLDGTYTPAVTINRGVMAVYIARAAGLNTSVAWANDFRDMTGAEWFAGAVKACSDAHIISGYPDFTYHPEILVTRDVMCKFIKLAAGIPAAVGADPTWTDWATINPVFQPFVKDCFEAGVVQGNTDGMYHPLDTITRDQLAIFVWRAFLRRAGSIVVLGGPAITDAVPGTDAIGYKSIHGNTGTDNAYIVVDAVRLGAAGDKNADGQFRVTFQLLGGATPTTVAWSSTVSNSVATITGWKTTALASGVAYKPIRAAIVTGGLEVGATYTLNVLVEGVPVNQVTPYTYTIAGFPYSLTLDKADVPLGGTVNVTWTAGSGHDPTTTGPWIGMYVLGDRSSVVTSGTGTSLRNRNYILSPGATTGTMTWTVPTTAGDYYFMMFDTSRYSPVVMKRFTVGGGGARASEVWDFTPPATMLRGATAYGNPANLVPWVAPANHPTGGKCDAAWISMYPRAAFTTTTNPLPGGVGCASVGMWDTVENPGSTTGNCNFPPILDCTGYNYNTGWMPPVGDYMAFMQYTSGYTTIACHPVSLISP